MFVDDEMALIVTLELIHVISPEVVAVTDGIEESVFALKVAEDIHPVKLSITFKL
jgi:hypothetical protein